MTDEVVVENSNPSPVTETVSTPTPEVKAAPESSPVAQKAREAIDNAKKGIFAEDKSAPEVKKDEPAAAASTDAPVIPVVPGAPEAYKPNYKFKVNNQEKEFDKEIQGLIKDKATEDKVRQLYADAEGLKPLQQKLSEAGQVVKKFHDTDKALRMLSHHVREKDFTNFFGDLKINEQEIFDWAEKRLREMSLDPRQQEELARVRENSRVNFLLSEENQSLKQTYEQNLVQERDFLLESELVRPDVQAIAQAFDSKLGKPGAFKQECVNRGVLEWQFGKRDITAAEAVAQVMSSIGRVMTPAQAAAMIPQTGAGTTPQNNVVPPQPPPVIPNVSGRSTSPVKKAVRSLDDIRAAHRNLANG